MVCLTDKTGFKLVEYAFCLAMLTAQLKIRSFTEDSDAWSLIATYIFSYTQKTLLGLNLESLDYEADLIEELPTSSKDNKTFYFKHFKVMSATC